MQDLPVIYEKKDQIGIIRLNRPENRNSMDAQTLPAFERALGRVKADKELRCLIITGSGSTFCGGADFKSGVFDDKDTLMSDLLLAMYKPFLEVGRLKIPVIAALNGHAIGGGLGLALMCDIRVADEGSRYGANFARLGLHSGMAISYILPRIVGLPKANELLFTGRIITGEEAAALGLVNYAVKQDQVMEKALGLAAEISMSAPAAVMMMKQSILRGLDWSPERAAEMESHIQGKTFEMEDAAEGIRALLEKRPPVFRGR